MYKWWYSTYNCGIKKKVVAPLPVLGCTPNVLFQVVELFSLPPKKNTILRLDSLLFGNLRYLWKFTLFERYSSSIDGQFSMAASISRGHLDLRTVCFKHAFYCHIARQKSKIPRFFLSDRGSKWVITTRGLIRWIPKVLKSTKSDMVFAEDMDVGQNGRLRGPPQIEMSSLVLTIQFG